MNFDILAIHSVADRVFEMRFKQLSLLLRRNSISSLNFCTGQLLTLFTGIYSPNSSHLFLDRVFESLLQYGWSAAFFLIGHILASICNFVEACSHDKLNLFWNALLKPSVLDILISDTEIVSAYRDREPSTIVSPSSSMMSSSSGSHTSSGFSRMQYEALLELEESQGRSMMSDCLQRLDWSYLRAKLRSVFTDILDSKWMPDQETLKIYVQEYLDVQKRMKESDA
jgi:hypothetical protein